ncbi:MAG: RHS repeat-associated core domain-containing protein [Desulfosalsimonadaceae bacterium]
MGKSSKIFYRKIKNRGFRSGTIYEYIRNNVDYVPYFGSLKGATLTYLDGSGNDFDQASLMIALLRAGGYTAQYVYGKMTIPASGDTSQKDIQHWLKVDANNAVIAKVFANGGIPATQSGANFIVDRIWVSATISGKNYLFDPAFKPHQTISGINLKSAMGYSKSAFLTAAGEAVGPNFVNHLNETGINTALNGYAMNLANYIRNNTPNAQTSGIIGGSKIVSQSLSALPTSLAFSNTPTYYWTDIPSAYVHWVNIDVNNRFGLPINIPDLNGKKLSIVFRASSTPLAQVWQDDLMIAEETGPITATAPCPLTLTIHHPYVTGGFNQEVKYTLKRGGTYVIIYDFGESRLGRLVEKRERQLQTYRESGFKDTDRQVLTESLNVIGMTWMRDTDLNYDLLGQIGGMIDLWHHRFGIVSQEGGYYIDVKAQMNAIASIRGDSIAEGVYMKTMGNMSSAMEHGVLEQMQVNRPAVSTVKLLQRNNYNGRWFAQVDSTNFAGIKTLLTNYSTQDLSDLQTSIDKGNTLILPADGRIALQSWSGKGYIDYKFTDTTGYIGMIIGGGYFGGYGASMVPVYVPDVNNYATLNITPQATTPKVGSSDPVDMASGNWMYENTDLSLSGSMGGLAMKRSYNSGNNNMQTSLGFGWTHNYNLYVEKHSSTPFGLGTRGPLDAAALITASVATLDVMRGTPDLKSWLVTALTNKWGMDQLTNNAASVHLGTDVLTFIKLPDGSFASPPGVTSKLVLANGLYRVDERFGRTINFNSDNRVSRITDADANQVCFTYSSGKLQSVADGFGHSLNFTYTGSLLTSVYDSAGRSVSYGYSANNLTTVTDPEGKIWRQTYDTNHRLLTLKNPRNITTVTNVYDTFGRVQKQTVPRQTGSVTYNLYFSGYRNIEEDAAGRQTIYSFDDKKHLLCVKNVMGQETTNTYDGRNHLISQIDPKMYTTSYAYDANDNLIKVTNALYRKSVNTYDSLFRLTDVTDPLSHKIHTVYDAEHHPTKTTVYPAVGQTISTLKSYYANGLVNTTTDGRGAVTTLTYNSYGNPATRKTATEPVIDYDYDAIGRMTALTDQAGSKTTFTYDKRGLLTSKTDPLSKTTSFTYYDDGTLWKITDRMGKTTTFTYTPTGKTNTITYQGGATVAYTYDQFDNLTKMQDAIGATTYTYDKLNRFSSSTDPRAFAISYTRDANGNITGITYPGSKTVAYTYDQLNHMKTVTIKWLGKTATYTYDAADRQKGLTQFNGTVAQAGFDNANRMTSLQNLTAAGGSVIAGYTYTLDANGNRTNISQTVPLSLSVAAANTAYAMNPQKNRLLQAGTTAFSYDNEGQLATKTGTTYTFDDAHRLTSTTAGAVTNTYRYDGAGNRLEATRRGVITRYIYDAAGNLLAEANGSNEIQKYYIYGNGLLAMVTSTGEIYCYHFDGTGNTVALTNASKAVVNKYAYTPFGTVGNKVEAVAQPFQYVGSYGVMAESNGLYFMRARYYDPKVGRFISEDPKGFDGGDVNLYAYAGNNPVMFVDPSGQWIAGAIIGGIGGAMGGVNSALMSNSSLKAAIAGGFFGGVAGAVAGGVLPDLVGWSAGSATGAAVGSIVGGSVGGAAGGAASDLASKGNITGKSVLMGAATGAFSGLVATPGVGLAAIATGGSDLGMALMGACGGIMGDTVSATGFAIMQSTSHGK